MSEDVGGKQCAAMYSGPKQPIQYLGSVSDQKQQILMQLKIKIFRIY